MVVRSEPQTQGESEENRNGEMAKWEGKRLAMFVVVGQRCQ
jgi:hypothetical protein